MTRALLFLDLDGVVVFETGAPLLPQQEILRLHPGLGPLLQALPGQVAVLTHRSGAEARRILEAAGIDPERLAGLLAAEELFRAGWKHGGPLGLIRHGLQKSWVLPLAEERFGVPREHAAFIDDRMDNLRDLLAKGLGLALHAPSAISRDGRGLVSFDMGAALEEVARWRRGERPGPLVTLSPQLVPLGDWQRTGLHTRKQGRHVFNAARRIGRAMRHPFRSLPAA
ncbi:hypothetical protein BKE38_01135 [Pseudoroseomonas deserti]|uniref:Hydrolase n=1 Tax=Teichococcus deserti TaxID=1817963 RepID=A0A1V2HA61_9PROT|nr:hypothetical protein [Pseudoroseomonas deserti]ONG58951.1 hypothetical protein BKE38_01135 [Pseudoroseomonas deserti]